MDTKTKTKTKTKTMMPVTYPLTSSLHLLLGTQIIEEVLRMESEDWAASQREVIR
jgi:hypothetical protein